MMNKKVIRQGVNRNIHERAKAISDGVKYAMAGLGAFMLIIVNYVGQVLPTERGMLENERFATFICFLFLTLSLMIGSVKIFMQWELEDKAIKFNNKEEKFKKYINNQVRKIVRDMSGYLMLISGALAVVSACCLMYIVLLENGEFDEEIVACARCLIPV